MVTQGVRWAVVVGASALVGCIVENNHDPPPPADTEIDFSESQNLGYGCDGTLTGWTVYNHEASEQGTAGCLQSIRFPGLTPGATYTFDITGYSGSRLCWTGSCQVVATPNVVTWADCSTSISHLCGF